MREVLRCSAGLLAHLRAYNRCGCQAATDPHRKDDKPRKGYTIATGSHILEHKKKPRTEKTESERKENTFLACIKQFIGNFGRRLHDPRFVIEVLALIGLVAYVVQTKRTNDISQQALKDAKEKFAEDERPWVWIEVTGKFHLKVGEIPYINVKVINYGKTPAITVRHLVFLIFTPYPTPQLVHSYQQQALSSYTIILAPNPAHSTYVSPRTEEAPLSQEEYDRVMSGKDFVIAGGRIAYSDLSGNSYESAFCFQRIPNDVAQDCPASELNYMK